MIRTVDEFLAKVSEDLVWRRKELSELKGIAQERKGDVRSRVVIRSAVSLLYAHWEGFVKTTSSYYLEFVASHRLPYEKLAPNFVALALKSKFQELGVSGKVSGANGLADFFCTKLATRSNIPYRYGVDTKSNLSSTVLRDILLSLGISIYSFETKMKFIDSNLLGPRNNIAHGERMELTAEEYFELHDEVIALLDAYKNELENAAVQRLFERIKKE